jgi:putative transposase
MTTEKTDQAVWRYGIISRLLHPHEEDSTQENELIRLASRPFRKPDGGTVTFSGSLKREVCS